MRAIVILTVLLAFAYATPIDIHSNCALKVCVTEQNYTERHMNPLSFIGKCGTQVNKFQAVGLFDLLGPSQALHLVYGDILVSFDSKQEPEFIYMLLHICDQQTDVSFSIEAPLIKLDKGISSANTFLCLNAWSVFPDYGAILVKSSLGDIFVLTPGMHISSLLRWFWAFGQYQTVSSNPLYDEYLRDLAALGTCTISAVVMDNQGKADIVPRHVSKQEAVGLYRQMAPNQFIAISNGTETRAIAYGDNLSFYTVIVQFCEDIKGDLYGVDLHTSVTVFETANVLKPSELVGCLLSWNVFKVEGMGVVVKSDKKGSLTVYFPLEIEVLLNYFWPENGNYHTLGSTCTDPSCMISNAGDPVAPEEDVTFYVKEGFKALADLARDQRDLVELLREKETKPSLVSKMFGAVSDKVEKIYASTKTSVEPITRFFKDSGIEFVTITPMQNSSLQELSLSDKHFSIKSPAMPVVNNASYIGNGTIQEIFGDIKDTTRFVFYNGTIDPVVLKAITDGYFKSGRVHRKLPSIVLVAVFPCDNTLAGIKLDFCKKVVGTLGSTIGISREAYEGVLAKPSKRQATMVVYDMVDLWPKMASVLIDENVNEVFIKTNSKEIYNEIDSKIGKMDVGYTNVNIDLTGVSIFVYVETSRFFKDTGFECPLITDPKVYAIYTGRAFTANGGVDYNGVLITVAHVFVLNGLSVGTTFHVCHLGKAYEYKVEKIDMSKELAMAKPVSEPAPSELAFDEVETAGLVSIHGSYNGAREFRQTSLGHKVQAEQFKGRNAFIAAYPAWAGMSGSPAIVTSVSNKGRDRIVAFHSYGVGFSFGNTDITVYLAPYVDPDKWVNFVEDAGQWYDVGFIGNFRNYFKSVVGSYHAVSAPQSPQHAKEEFIATCFEWSIIVVVAILFYRYQYNAGYDSISIEIYTDHRLATLAKAADAGVLGMPAVVIDGFTNFVASVFKYFLDHPGLIVFLTILFCIVEGFGFYEYHSFQGGIFYQAMYAIAHEIWIWLIVAFKAPHALCGLALANQDIQTFAFIQAVINIPVAYIAASIGYHSGRKAHVRAKEEVALNKDLKKVGMINKEFSAASQMALLVSSMCALVVGSKLFNSSAVPHSAVKNHGTGPMIALTVLILAIGIVIWGMSQNVVKTKFYGNKKDFLVIIRNELPNALGLDANTTLHILGESLKFKKVLQKNNTRRVDDLINALESAVIPGDELHKGKGGHPDVIIKSSITPIDVTKLIVEINNLKTKGIWTGEEENKLAVKAAQLFPKDAALQGVVREGFDSRMTQAVGQQVIPVKVETDLISHAVMAFAYFMLIQQTPIVLTTDRIVVPIIISLFMAVMTSPLKEWIVTFPFQQEQDLASYYVNMACSFGYVVVAAPSIVDNATLSVLTWDKVDFTQPYVTLYQALSCAIVGVTFMLPLVYPMGEYNSLTLWEDLANHVLVMGIASSIILSGTGQLMLSKALDSWRGNSRDVRPIGWIPCQLKKGEELKIHKLREKTRNGKKQRLAILGSLQDDRKRVHDS